MQQVPYEQTSKYVKELFKKKDYATLESFKDPLQRFQYIGDAWESLFFLCIHENDVRMFRHFLHTHGLGLMDQIVRGPDEESGWCALDTVASEGGNWGDREFMVLYEILLDEGAPKKLVLEEDGVNCYMGSAWRDSKKCKKQSLAAAVWCFQAIRGADGLEELLGKRMQAGSTWDYEPPMKRCRF